MYTGFSVIDPSVAEKAVLKAVGDTGEEKLPASSPDDVVSPSAPVVDTENTSVFLSRYVITAAALVVVLYV